tara:strand:+ start:609 stop:902 length:294 start_codon:yes stop_codon:yes gene_type:complete
VVAVVETHPPVRVVEAVEAAVQGLQPLLQRELRVRLILAVVVAAGEIVAVALMAVQELLSLELRILRLTLLYRERLLTLKLPQLDISYTPLQRVQER